MFWRNRPFINKCTIDGPVHIKKTYSLSMMTRRRASYIAIMLLYVTAIFFFFVHKYIYAYVFYKSHIIIEIFIVREIIHFYLYIIFFSLVVVATAPTATGQLSYTFV